MIRCVSELFDSEDYEMKKSKSNKRRDRLSELPDSLILLILSFLPMRYVVRTTLLSKRWKDLWTTVPCLDFSDEINDSGRVQNFVNRALILWKGTKILKFRIDFFSFTSLSSDLDLWVRFAVENKVEELDIGLMYAEDVIMSSEDAGYWAPQSVYSCSSIRKLSIYSHNLKIHGDLHWNQLKSLRIEDVCLSEHVVNQVLSGTPQLEVLKLFLIEDYENLNIQSSSLKKLKIRKDLSVDDPATDTVLRIWAPNLETLVISGVLYSKCLLMNVSSLTDATFGFYVPKDYDYVKELLGEMFRQIFPTIHQVEKITLSDWCIKVVGVMGKKYLLSSSSDVKFLKLSDRFIELNKIVDLLEIFPKLKMLVIEHTGLEQHLRETPEFDAEHKSFPLQLRTVEITWFLCDTSIFPFIEFLLKHASMLEKMVIRAKNITSLAPESFVLASQKLLKMPRSSPIAEVILCKKLSSPSYLFQS